MKRNTEHNTGIEWTHVPGFTGETWNPVRGCTKISPGCKHCYAETFAERWRGVPGHPYEQGFDLRLVPEKLDEPLRATKPRAYFVNSMSDLFHEGVDFDFVADVFRVQAAHRRHLFMTLTKRPDRMRLFFAWTKYRLDKSDRFPGSQQVLPRSVHDALSRECGSDVIPNAWLGVSVEDRKYGLPRIDIIREIPAAVRFLSIEPLLEDLGPLDLRGIHWVIVGGESGHNARNFDEAWAMSIAEQCKEQNVPVFIKQLGAAPVRRDTMNNGLVPLRLKSKKGSDESEWPERLRGLKQFPKVGGAA